MEVRQLLLRKVEKKVAEVKHWSQKVLEKIRSEG